MKANTIILLLVFFLFSGCVSAQQSCKVTYIANEGFLAESGNHRIMFDGLFGDIKGDWCEEPGDSVIGLIMNAAEPFGKTDIVFISHKHIDHFKESLVTDFLNADKETTLICPSQVSEILFKNPENGKIASRIITVNTDDTTFVLKGIGIRAVKMKHGPYPETDSVTGQTYDRHKDIQNYVYIINLDGQTLLHTGDCSTFEKKRFEDCGITKGSVNTGFFNRSFLGRDGMEILNLLEPENLILMHIEPGQKEYYKSIIKDTPGIYIFGRKLESKEFNRAK